MFEHPATATNAVSLESISFDPPKMGVMLENYVVDYRISTGAISYASGFSVYVYDSDGTGYYLVKEPYLSPQVSSAVASAISSLTTWLAPSPVMNVDPLGYLFAELKRAGFLKNRDAEDDIRAASYYLIRDILGYSTVDPLIRDPHIEDISCEGLGRPVKVWHRKYNSRGWLRTNIVFYQKETLDAAVSRLVHRSNRSLSASSPIVDSVLPEGYRLTATWGNEVTSLGSSFSIRKLRAIPFTLADLVHEGTLDATLGAYLWLMLEMKGFVVIAGVTASGKTTLLNALGTMINPNWKLLSIEDTREINLPQSGWKPLHTKHTLTGGIDVTLFDLVKLSLRERPDFVILGESRGEEVQALFQVAASGSGCLTTFHASNVDGFQVRLTQPPLSVARSSLDLIDAVVFMVRDQEGRRFVEEVVEPGTGWTTVFRRGDASATASLESSRRLERKAFAYGYSGKKMLAELDRRKRFLESAVGRGISGYDLLAAELRKFYGSDRTFCDS
jgi:archaeal flagellar protein FlaI